MAIISLFLIAFSLELCIDTVRRNFFDGGNSWAQKEKGHEKVMQFCSLVSERTRPVNK